ncbi:MAG: DNA-3-methyladenine glycosylase [Candidatus Parcubacteria bacterium]|nr:DNA-3-methyladenine glycosylase [Candidatus Parcubacteria bacterium]
MPKLKRLTKNFYHQNTFTLAKALLGKFIIRKIGTKILMGKIVETEAYYGPNDLASHASRGKTERTKIMFDPAGTAYIYLIYGMYNCFNIVTEAKDFPAAILIRAAEPSFALWAANGKPLNFSKETNGPGKLCRAFKIDKKLNGENLITSKKLYLAADPQIKIRTSQIKNAKRIGVDYAGKYKDKLWRFYLKDNPFVSKK